MQLAPFAVERWLARYEFSVPYNIAESCAQPLTLAELAGLAGGGALDGGLRLGYGDSAGGVALRAAIAALYPGARTEDVVVTVGAIEANFLSLSALCAPGDRVVVAAPAYQQLHEVPRAQGAEVELWPLRPEDGWRPDLDALRRMLRRRTKVVVANFPNNPTGATADLDALAALCAEHGAILHSDEVYRGLPGPGRAGQGSAWGGGAPAVVVGSLSKAYGLPGLRVGWLLAPPALRARVQEIRDYTSICPPAPSEALAVAALGAREAVLERQRRHVADNRRLVAAALAGSAGRLDWVAPEEGVVGCVRCACNLTARDFATRLAEERGTLVVPGDCFGLEGCCFRLGFGYERDRLAAGLERLAALASEV